MRSAPSIITALAALALPGTALAHHPMGGAVPQTVAQGLLSGLAHPVIGIDHLAFVIAAGVLAAGVADRRTRLALPLVFLGAGVIGTLLHVAGIGLGPVEIIVAASVLLAGGLLLRRQAPTAGALVPIFAVAGLFHGHAFAESIIGSETGALVAYLLGLAAVQAAIAYAAMEAARRFAAADPVVPRRWAGAAACAVGVLAGSLALIG